MRIRMNAAMVKASSDARTISGLLVPFNATAAPSVGPQAVEFDAQGTHSAAGRIWLNEEHEETRRLGFAEDLTVDEDGIWATFSILDITRGRDAVIEAASGARDGLSVEAEILDHLDVDGVTIVTASRITGAALTMRPAFDAARVTVAATEADPQPDETPATAEVEETDPEAEDTPGEDPQEEEDMDTIAPPITTASRTPGIGDIILAAARGDHGTAAQMIRAAGSTLTTDVAGLIPAPIVMPIIDLFTDKAPLFAALGNHQAPQTNVFTVPIWMSIGTATVNGAELLDVSTKFEIKDVTVDVASVKVSYPLSIEAIQWGHLNQLEKAAQAAVKAAADAVETYTVTTIGAATGTNAKVTVAANGSDAWAKVTGAVNTAHGATNNEPSLFALDPGTFSKLAGMTNAIGAPLISGIDNNLNGGLRGTIYGIPAVQSRKLTKSYLIDTDLVQSWSQPDVVMRVDNAKDLGKELGLFRGVAVSIGSPKGITEIAVATA